MKRSFDFITAGVALLLLSPVLAIIGLVVLAKLGPPILFKQTRPGLDGKPFTLVKFRTMTAESDRAGELLSDACRMTKFGKFLRESSMDELPELWNVIKGDMSLVGPRPLLMEYLPLYNEVQRRRHDVRPGITGLAQVEGRNAISWEEKFHLDVWYVENRTFWLDLRILGMTVLKVLRRQNISSTGEATMPRFKGTR